VKLSDILTRKRWIKGDYENSIGQCCLVGGLRKIVGKECYDENGYYTPEFKKQYNNLYSIIEKLHPGYWGSVENFNDNYARTYEEIEEIVKHYDAHFANEGSEK
jgi:hypothetical protein